MSRRYAEQAVSEHTTLSDFKMYSSTVLKARHWHEARAIARARAVTRANEEKGGLDGR